MAQNGVFSFLSEKVFHSKKEEVENLLALKIGMDSVAATFWVVKDGTVEIGKVSIAPITSTTFEHMLSACDEVVSKVSGGLEPEPRKIIFGVDEDWIENGKLHAEKLSNLRKICKELEMTPMGFVAMNEAVENFLREVEGVPPTAILIGVDKNKMFVTLLRAGRNLGTHVQEFEDNIGEHLEKAIKKFDNIDFLPARIIVYDGRSDMEALKQKIVAYPWTQKLPFLHFPKVEILDTESSVKAIAVAGGVQLGGQLDLTDIDWVKQGREVEQEVSTVEQIEEQPEIESHTADGELPSFNKEFDLVDPGNFGFDQSVSETENITGLQDIESPKGVSKSIFKMRMPKFSLKPITGLFAPTETKLSKKGVPTVVIVFFLIIALVSVGSVAAFYFLPKATITVFVETKPLNKTLDLTIYKTAQNAPLQLQGKTIDAPLTITKKGVTTGKKLVGTRAKGSVTIYNSNGAKTFPLGTSISANGIKFTLDQSVTLASSSGLASQSTATANVTAADIGENYNLPAGTLFSIAGLPTSSYQGKSDGIFTGGASHLATVVAKDDQTRLIATASAELELQAKEVLRSKLGPGETLLDKAITSKIDKKKFSKDVDNEAESLTLDLTTVFTGLVFDDKEAKNIFKQDIAPMVPSEYTLSFEDISSNLVKVTVNKAGDYILTLDFSGVARPSIDITSITKDSVGQKIEIVENKIKSFSGVNHLEIKIAPEFINILNRMPFEDDRIKVEIVTM